MNNTASRSATRRPAALLSAIAALAISGTALADGPVWQELGPAPISNGSYTGRVSAVVCSPTDANVYYVAGADGGVWKTTDGGLSWTPLSDDWPTSAIGALALDPGDENVIYAGTGEANYANHSRYGVGLLKSTDAGQTWTLLAESTFAGRCFSSIVVDPTNPNVVYASITRAGGFPELAAAKGHPAAAGPLGAFRSDDGGATWTHLTNGLPALSATSLALDPTNPTVVYVGIGRIFGSPDNGIYKSLDGGASWTRLAGGLPTGVGRITVAVAPTNPQRLYALITNPCDAFGGGASMRGAYRSDDAGATWSQMPLSNIQASYGWYLSVVSVSPADANTVFMGGLSFERSTNSGASWSTVTPPHVDLHAAAWDAAGRLVVGDDGGVHRSSNLGGTWSSLNDGLGLIQFYAGASTHPTDDRVLFGGTQDNGTNRRSTDSLLWTQVFGGDGGWTQLDQLNPSRVFCEFQGTGNLYRSTNGGNSFSAVGSGISGSDRNCFLPPYLIHPENSSLMLYATHRIYRSTNGGTSFSIASGDLTNGPPAAIRSLALAPSDPDVVYAATNDGNIAVSFNFGASFETMLSGVPGWPRVTRELFVSPHDAFTAYLAVAQFGQDQVRRTRDAGQTWEVLDGDLPDLPVNTVAADERGPMPVLYAGTDVGVYRSIDDGDSWHRFGEGLPTAAVIDLRLETPRSRLIAMTQGRGAWLISLECDGDLTGDLRVDFADMVVLLGAYDVDAAGDLDGDADTDFDDLLTLLGAYGSVCP